MKTALLRPILSCIGLAVCLGHPPTLTAQDAKPDPGKTEESTTEEEEPMEEEEEPADKNKPSDKEEPDASAEEQPEIDMDELKERNKKEKEREAEAVAKMMKVFKGLEGEWVGKEKTEYQIEQFKPLDRAWDDEWKGFYTMEGRYFEMTGQSKGEEGSNYRWVCTWDDEKSYYRAWYFGDNGFNRYVGQLSEDKSHVVWTHQSENGSVSEFTMLPDKDRVKCQGTETMAGGRILSKTKSTYTRKRVEL